MFLDITKGQFLRYTLLPGVVPRCKSFIAAGFGNLAFFMALVYQAVNLLPSNHIYLQTKAIGTFSIRDVLSAASSNLVFSTKHLDQIIIFFSLLAGIVLLALQFFLLLISFFVKSASAAMPTNYAEFFTTKNPSEDWAFRLLDSVFGIDGLFGSKEPVDTAFHKALGVLFQFYSTGLLVIAAIIISYFIFAVLAETAETGTPFGKRFNHVWAPIRLVAAIGLLIPIGAGYNSGQWIALYAAKFGSGFATNGWIKFNETITDTILSKETLVSNPEGTSLEDQVGFMFIAKVCAHAYVMASDGGEPPMEAYILNPDSTQAPQLLSATSYLNAAKLSNYDTIRIRIGLIDNNSTEDTGKVRPYCGDITITVNGDNTYEFTGGSSGEEGEVGGKDIRLTAAGIMPARYYVMLDQIWKEDGDYKAMAEAARDMVTARMSHTPKPDPTEEMKKNAIKKAEDHIYDGIKITRDAFLREFKKDDNIKFGWAGAGIWYNKIAEVNGSFVDGVMAKPNISKFPKLMEKTCEENMQQNANTDPRECYKPQIASEKDVQYELPIDKKMAKTMGDAYAFWNVLSKKEFIETNNKFIDTVNLLFGTKGLFDMCKNADIHPLAQLSALGKGLVQTAIRNFGVGLGGKLFSGIPVVGPVASAVSSFAISIASIAILLGFMLYYIIPFLPFLYFLFAVGGWVKGLFEAMVGIPLWALAHLRIDGQGLPGDAAINGYFLIFEIFIRPILIVFGLLASILVFGAMVKVLNDVFSLVVSNLSGYSGDGSSCGSGTTKTIDTGNKPTGALEYFRGPVDEFFFTIVYAILVYMIGMSSFKLIDLIPNHILRWMGAGVSTFADQAGEPAEGLLTKMAVGGRIMGGKLQEAASQGAQSVTNIAGGLAKGPPKN